MAQYDNSISAASSTTRLNRALVGALWCIGIGLLANAAVSWTGRQGDQRAVFPDISLDNKTYAQMTSGAPGDRMLGAKGYYMMPGQLGPDTWGLYLMDVDSGTICVYRSLPGTSRFKLMAARSFKYDRFLDDLNNESPTPREVQKQVEAQRQRDQIEQKEEPKP